mmetsp:Transcript_3785/g.13516  ORF Transcript_3785/g.13516 Transcript_3785/m.13516 type:complete len:197 (-) Transcript_3785:1559-2149(-)
MIIQHDRGFVRGFNALPVVRTMLAKPSSYNYVALPTSSMRDYRNFVSSKYQLHVQTVEEAGGLRMVQMVQYFDSTHFASTKWYRDTVFCPGGNFVRPKGQAKRSMFIEDKFGQEQLAELREKGLEDAFGKYSTWLLDIFDGQPAAGHIDGRDNRLQEANYYKYKFTKADAYSQEDLEFVGEQKSPAAPEEDDARAV